MNKENIKEILNKMAEENPDFALAMRRFALKAIYKCVFWFLLGFIIGKLI